MVRGILKRSSCVQMCGGSIAEVREVEVIEVGENDECLVSAFSRRKRLVRLISVEIFFHQPISTHRTGFILKNERALEIGKTLKFTLRQATKEKENRMTMRWNRVAEESTNQERARRDDCQV